jgi:hypothetical protein
MQMFGVEVVEGEVVVNHVRQVVDDPHAKIWEVDLSTKYADVLSYGSGAGHLDVSLCATADSLNVDEAKAGRSTVVRIEVPDAGRWRVMGSAARYTARIAVWDES